MITMSFLSQIFGVFGSGVLASVSPCVYPILPITLSFMGSQTEKEGSRFAILLYCLGQALTLFVLGIVAVKIGETLGFSSQTPSISFSIGLLLLVLGAFSWKGKLPAFLSRIQIASPQKGKGLLSSFLLGVSAALVMSPCTSPVLGGVLALIATAGSMHEGLFLMFIYSVGFTFLFLLLGLGVLKLKNLPKSGSWLTIAHRASSVLLLLGGLFYLAKAFGIGPVT